MQDDILKQVTLLGAYKKEPDESMEDVMTMLVETGMYPDGKSQALEIFQQLQDEHLLTEQSITMQGIIEAKKVEEMFKQS